jgi:membrane protein
MAVGNTARRPRWPKELEVLAARLRPTLLIRSARRFRLIDGRNRALVLAGQAFTTLIPLMIASAGLVGSRGGASLADNLVRRFRLDGGSADAVRVLFTQAPATLSTMSVAGLLVLLVSLLAFTRSLQRTYEAAWELPARGMRGTLHGFGGTSMLFAQVIALTMLTAALRGPAAPIIGPGLRALLAFPLWLVLQYLLLSRRVPLRALWPGAVVAAVGQSLVSLGSAVWMPVLVARNEERYGVIGVTFALLTWLIVLAFMIVVVAVVSAEIASGPRIVKPASGPS